MDNIGNRIGNASTTFDTAEQFANDSGLSGKQSSTLFNETATVVDGEISLTDDAEELSLYMGSKTEAKHHAERKIKPEIRPQVFSAEAVSELLEKTRDPEITAKLVGLSRLLLAGHSNPRQALSQAFSGATQQFLALQYVLRQGESEKTPNEILENLHEILADLEMESGPQIRAGLNTIDVAHDFGEDQQAVSTFQATYSDIVLGENTLSKSLDVALERFGGKDVARGLTQLITAIGLDIAAAQPSTDRTRLHALTRDMYLLETAVTVLENANLLGAKLKLPDTEPFNAAQLMRDLVAITSEKYVAESRFSRLATTHGAKSVQQRIAFLNDTRTMLKELPTQVFIDDDRRTATLSAAQEALDIAADDEDNE